MDNSSPFICHRLPLPNSTLPWVNHSSGSTFCLFGGVEEMFIFLKTFAIAGAGGFGGKHVTDFKSRLRSAPAEGGPGWQLLLACRDLAILVQSVQL